MLHASAFERPGRRHQAFPPGRRRAASPRRQRGVVLVTVSVVGLILVAVLSAVAAYFGQTESRAVAASLLQVRAHWAMMGHVHYTRSRLREVSRDLEDTTPTVPSPAEFATAMNVVVFDAAEPPSPPCPTPPPPGGEAELARCLLNELLTQGAGTYQRCWTFDEYGLMTEAVAASATLPNDAAPLGVARNGLRLRIELTGIGSHGGQGTIIPPPCGDTSAPPPSVAGVDLDRLVVPLGAGLFVDPGAGSEIENVDISDLWRSRE